MNIETLDIQIRSSAGSAATNIEKLAISLERLRNNASLTKVSNNLSKLAKSLSDLKVSTGTVGTIKGLAGALKSLAAVQDASGLRKLVKVLKDLPSVVNALNPATVTAFATSMRSLATALAPLSVEIQRLSTGMNALPARIRQIASGTDRMARATRNASNATEDHGQALDHQSVNLMSTIQNLETYIHWATSAAQAVGNLLNDAIQWDGIQYRFGRAFGEDAEEVLAYVEKVNDALAINTQQFMQYSSLYGSLLSGFGMQQEQVTTISVGLTELSYDIWAAYNDRYKRLEDATEAVRSAITGEIEPIRNAGIALTEASMQEYLDSIGMAAVSIEKLTEAQKAEVRYAVMMNSAMQQGIVGTYAKEMQTAEGAMRSMSQSLKTLGQAFGSLFIPILQKVIPYLTAFVELLTEAVHWVAGLFGIELFKIDWNTGSGGVSSGLDDITTGADNAAGALGSAADAAKKLKDYTLGFDELNVIEPPSDSASGGGSGGGAGGSGGIGSGGSLGLDLDTLWDESVLAAASKQIEKLKEKMRPTFEWLKENIDEILDIAMTLIGVFAAWKLTTKFTDAIKNVVDAIKNPSFLGKANKISLGITLLVSGITLNASGAYDIGYDGPTLMNVIKTALGAALSIGGSLLLFGTGPVGWTVGIGIALVTTIVGITVGANQRKIDDEIKERFGEIELDDEMIEVWVDKITAVPREITIDATGKKVSFDSALEIFVSEKEVADSMRESLVKAIDEIEKLDYKIALGIEVTYEEYVAAIDRFLVDGQEYLDQAYLQLGIALSFLDGETGSDLSSVLSSWYAENNQKLTELGGKLKQTISEAFVDGEWIPDKLEEAKEIQAEIQAVMEKLSDVEFRAKMQGLKIEAAGTELTFESFSKVLEGANEAITEKLEALDEVKMSQLQVAVMEYDTLIEKGVSEADAKRFLDERTAEIEAEYQSAKLELEYGTYEFGLDTLRDHFGDALSDAESKGLLDFNQQWADTIHFNPGHVFDEGAGEVYGNIEFLAYTTSEYYQGELSKIEPEIRGALEETLEAMTPQVEDYKKIAEDSREAGVAVPENVRRGLSDYNELAALSGDAKAINYMLGETFSTDKTFLNTLATVEDAGKQIDESVAEGLFNSIELVRDPATGAITEIVSTINGERTKVTPTMIENFEEMGLNLADGLYEGAAKEAKAKKKSWLDWAVWPWNWFKEKNEIASPSKLFERGGGYLSDGLLKGVTSGWTDIKSWFNTNVSPKLTLTYWKTKFDGIKEGLGAKLDEAWKKVKDFFSYEEWKKKVTDAIDAIKENFKIPSLPKIKLGVTYSTDVGKAKKAIYEALGLSGWPSLSWSTYAQGGFPATGQMFIAREAGPEMVGSINGRTAVANNDQIVTAVSQGVYQAVLAAMSGSRNGNGQQSVNVYLDGKQIYASVKKTESERGLSLMGSQLGYAY